MLNSWEITLRIIDLVFFHGKVALFRFSMALIYIHQETILKQTDGTNIFPAIREIPSAEEFIHVSLFFIRSNQFIHIISDCYGGFCTY